MEGKVIRGWAAEGTAWGWSSLGRLLLCWGWIHLTLMEPDHKPVMHRASEAVLEAAGEVLQKGSLSWTDSSTALQELGCCIWGIKHIYATDCFRYQVLGFGVDERMEWLPLSKGGRRQMGVDEAEKWPFTELKWGNLFQNLSATDLKEIHHSVLTYFSIRMCTGSDMQQRKNVTHGIC